MQRGIIHRQVIAFNPELGHDGLDIVISSRAVNKSTHQLELSDFELINRGCTMPHSEFNQGPIADLFNKVILKYFEQPKLKEVKEQMVAEAKKTTRVSVNGKIIKAIEKCEDESYNIITHDESTTSPELHKAVNDILRVKGIADAKMQEQMVEIADKLRIGTLDMPDGKELHVHVPKGTEKVSGKVTRKQLIATLWFVSKMYMYSPTYRKYIGCTIEDGKYVCGYKNGEPYFETKGLSQLELDIINDLSTIKES